MDIYNGWWFSLFSLDCNMLLFLGLKVRKLTIDERLDILLNTKWTVKEYNTELTREIEELIDREADMINRGRPI